MSSQKKRTPAEELMDSLLNEVEAGSNETKSSIGVVNLDATSASNMNFQGLLRDNRAGVPLEKTQVYNPATAAKTEVKTQVKTKVQSKALTQITSLQLKDVTEINSDMQTSMKSEFSSEENSAYESNRIAKSVAEDDQHTEFGKLELESMEAHVVDLQDLSAQEEQASASSSQPEVSTKSPPAEITSLMDDDDDDDDESPNHHPEEVLVDASLMTPPEPPQVGDVSVSSEELAQAMSLFDSPPPVPGVTDENVKTQMIGTEQSLSAPNDANAMDSQIATVAIHAPSMVNPGTAASVGPGALSSSSAEESDPSRLRLQPNVGDSTVAVTGFQIKLDDSLEDKVKVSVGKASRSSGFASWGGGVDSSLSQAENLRMAQEKILELENESERLRRQNEELIAASEILKERSDLMMAQLTEYKNDRDGLEQSFKNEMTLVKNHLARKDAELKKAQFKVEELEARLKFDLKKIRVRERELENRLELVRAEKNAISKNKDEQILDLRRKMDVMQMEVDSYRQKCVELNKQIENSQDSFKRTTRALRLAMANLELQEENKGPLKKAE